MTVDDTAGLRVAFSDEIEREVCVLCEREGERETETGKYVLHALCSMTSRTHTHNTRAHTHLRVAVAI
jgi:hypothetical protein